MSDPEGPAERRALVVQHAEVESPGAIAGAMERAGVPIEVCRADRGDAVPAAADGLAALIVMGGPASAASEAGFPTRGAELALLADALARGVAVLGVCLGAQLLAVAGGGRVEPGGAPEVGWGEVELTRPAAMSDLLFAALPSRLEVLHWHSEVFTAPPRAVPIATGRDGVCQAFRAGERAWGLQFHLEVDAAMVDAFCTAFPADAAGAAGGADAIRAEGAAALDAMGPRRDAVLDRFARLARA